MLLDRTTRFTHDGLRFEVRDEGPFTGLPTILLHGFPQDAASWNRVVPLLHQAGLRTLRFDQRGYGLRARPPKVGDYALPHLVGDVLALADAAGLERFHLVGHDWGAGVAWQAAADHPDRVATLTSLSTPHPAALLRVMRSSDQPRRSWYMAAFQLPLLPERVLSRRLGPSLQRGGLSPVDAERYAARFSHPAELTGPINWYRAASLWVRGNQPTGKVSVPTCYVWGNRDQALGPDAAHATRDFVTGDYKFVELDAGHWLPEQCARPVAQAVAERIRG